MNKLRFLAVVAAAFAGGCVTQAVMNGSNASAQDAEPAKQPVEGKVQPTPPPMRAGQFDLVDGNGKVCAKLGFGADGTPNLWLTDSQGKEYAQFPDVNLHGRQQQNLKKMQDAIAELGTRKEREAADIEVQHILITFAGSPAGQGVTRSKTEAEQLAADVFARAKAGEDFSALMKEFSGDPGPGTYKMTTKGTTDQAAGMYSRKDMVPAFGDTGWKLDANEIGVAAFDKQKSPFGWHIIKRLK